MSMMTNLEYHFSRLYFKTLKNKISVVLIFFFDCLERLLKCIKMHISF